MELDDKTKILTSWCATSPEKAHHYFPRLVYSVDKSYDETWQTLLDILNAPRLRRILTMARSRPQKEITPLDLNQLTVAHNQVLWEGEPIGETQTFYKTVMPYEAQAKVAYELFFDRFELFLTQTCQAVVLQSNEFSLKFFIPLLSEPFELETIWQAFIEASFSLESLKQWFSPLVNTIKMTERGFSALDVPIINKEQAQFLAAFYWVNLKGLQRGDDKRKKEITELETKLKNASTDKEQQGLEKKIEKIAKELDTRVSRYGPLYQQIETYRAQYPQWMTETEGMCQFFRPLASTQIAKATAKIAKCITQIGELAQLDSAKFYQFPLLLKPAPMYGVMRPGGDSQSKTCYACGREIGKTELAYSANKFIFESPSQRLQSGGSQVQPKVCAVCAALSFISPIKLGEGRLVVRMKSQADSPQQARYLANDQLHMLILGEMNLVAGKYVILQANEKSDDNKPIFDTLGGLQYALYKVGTSFEPTVFEEYQIEAMINSQGVDLINRYLAWLHWLDEVFSFRSAFSNKKQFAALGRAIRYVQKEEMVFAIYELLKAGLTHLPLGGDNARQLEELREQHVRWLEMDKQKNKAQLFKDVAAMTGLMYAFCSYVKTEVKKAGGNERIEVRKVIERSDEPYQFNYTVADNTHSEMATLYRQADMYFSYDQLKRLLPELGVNVAERESLDDKNQIRLKLYFDDVVNAHQYLFDNYYKSKKEQRDFSYQVKLSLHARFPELIEANKKENN